MPRYGYYDSEAQPKEPIDELSNGGPLVTAQDEPDEEKASKHKAKA
jgi:hypothetical protein